MEMKKVTDPKVMKFSAKIIGCLVLLLPLVATFFISYILSSWNWQMIARDYYYRSVTKRQETNSGCNLFTGNWTTSSLEPYYTNASNCIIDGGQDCLKMGRPHMELLKWRWKPDECELPRFNATLFLELMRGKIMAFIGDSLARNHVHSLTCMLTQAEDPVDISDGDWKVRRFRFANYNFTIENLWSVYLVKSEDADTSIYGPFSNALYLDEADKVWTSYIHTFDYVIISSAHWFLRPLVYYKNGKVVGCYECKNSTVPNLGMYYGYRNAFKTAYRALLDSDEFKGTVFLRTYSPRYFENGKWYSGGICPRTSPTEMNMEEYQTKLYRAAIEELKAAEKKGRRKLKFGILDFTGMMTMRPDAHPYRHGAGYGYNKTASDCLHWCLPGPVDTWNEILLQLLLLP